MPRTSPNIAVARLCGAALLLGVAVVVLLPAGAASAAAYRYWGYYQLSGTTWQFATKGPDQTTPADGSVEGWRFAVGTEEATRYPRAVPTFDELCGDTKAAAGEKRVAVVIDYGRPADTADGTTPPVPVGRCAVVAAQATGLEVLSKVAEVRTEKGLLCGIDDFPASGCGDTVAVVSNAAQEADTPVTLKLPSSEKKADTGSTKDDEGSNAGTYVGIAVVLVAGAAVGLAVSRRRRDA